MNFQDPQAEHEIIGAMLTKKQAYLDIFDIITAQDFEVPYLGKCFDLISDAFRNDTDISLSELARQTGAPADKLVIAMEDGDLAALFAKAKAKKLRGLANKRRVYHGCRELLALMGDMEPVDLSTRLSEIAAMISMGGDAKQVYSGTDMNRRVVESQKARQDDPGVIRGILTRYECLDQTLRGLRPKRMTVIAAGTGFGKTTLALNLFNRIVDQGKSTLFISNENDVDDNLDRLCAMGAGISLQDVEGGLNYRNVCMSFKEKYQGKKAFISDNSPRTVDEIVVTIQRHVMQHRVEIVFVDYVGEISGDALKNEAEEGKLARYTQRLLDATKQMGVHLVLLAQLNREGNKIGRPSKTELAGCFRIAQKAHCLILFWQDEQKNDIVSIEKNRQGPAHVDILVKYDRAKQMINEEGFWDVESKQTVKIQSSNPPHYQDNDLPC
jgi:replicative DNA helicase